MSDSLEQGLLQFWGLTPGPSQSQVSLLPTPPLFTFYLKQGLTKLLRLPLNCTAQAGTGPVVLSQLPTLLGSRVRTTVVGTHSKSLSFWRDLLINFSLL